LYLVYFAFTDLTVGKLRERKMLVSFNESLNLVEKDGLVFGGDSFA